MFFLQINNKKKTSYSNDQYPENQFGFMKKPGEQSYSETVEKLIITKMLILNFFLAVLERESE